MPNKLARSVMTSRFMTSIRAGAGATVAPGCAAKAASDGGTEAAACCAGAGAGAGACCGAVARASCAAAGAINPASANSAHPSTTGHAGRRNTLAI
ncbi:MAG TPA: hypothetical protein P5163_04610 [Rubrivivax sp.]|nr:hypothetical protein [Rubrivivax sp.]HRZ59853.1 hypothetical protein [Rubrivivax sp.]